MKHINDMNNIFARDMGTLPVLLSVMVALILAVSVPMGWAQDEFDEAHIFFELNNTDGDLGIHALIDGDAWEELYIYGPGIGEMLDIKVKSNLQEQGLTELFFESAEPGLCPLPDPPGCELGDDIIQEAIQDFKDRFPEGTYTFKGMTIEGCIIVGEAELTHSLLDPVVLDIA